MWSADKELVAELHRARVEDAHASIRPDQLDRFTYDRARAVWCDEGRA